jgi:hypothetical protein
VEFGRSPADGWTGSFSYDPLLPFSRRSMTGIAMADLLKDRVDGSVANVFSISDFFLPRVIGIFLRTTSYLIIPTFAMIPCLCQCTPN